MIIMLAFRQCQRVRVATAAGFFDEFIEAQVQLGPRKPEAALLKLDLLIQEAVGFAPFSRAGADLLFGILTDRDERGSVFVTSNLDSPARLRSSVLSAGLLDRLSHRCDIVEFQADSFR